MMGIPQLVMFGWFAFSLTSAVLLVARPPRDRLVLTPKQQRIITIVFAVNIIGEAALLYQGGFFDA